MPLKIARLFMGLSFWIGAAASQIYLIPAIAGSTPTSVALTATPDPALYGQIVTLTAAVSSPSATGSVTFYDGVTVLGTGPLAGGLATLFTILLPSGSRSLWAYYGGDANYAASKSATAPENVNAVSGLFQAAVSVAPYGPGFVALGDFNGDGKADIAFSGAGAEGGFPSVLIVLGNGDGTFRPPKVLAGGCGWPQAIAIGDFNGDGKADLAATNSCYGGVVDIFLGNGDGTFQEPVSYTTGGNPPFIAVGDFNGDGKADLAVSDACTLEQDLNVFAICVGTSTSILLGNGDGTFRRGASYNFIGSVVVGDFNGDGKADLVAGGGVLLGNGDGTFQKALSYGVLGAVAVGDFNGDGKSDLAAVNSDSVSVLLGNGDGTFRVAVNYAAAPSSTSIVIGDFNGDGRADLVSGGSLLLGNGDGTFQTAVSYADGFVSNFTAVGAFRGDGRADLAASTGNGLSVILNTAPTPDLTIAKTHSGNFTQGQTGANYTITISNIGSAATSGVVTVTDTLPGGLTASGISGTGWSCVTTTVTCTRSDALATSASYPSITVTVNVAANAAVSVTNTATVSGGGETDTSNDTASDLTHINIAETSQTITFAPLSGQTLSTAPFLISATATSGLTVSFISNASAVCIVSGTTVTLVAIGTCSITATQGGNATYAAAVPVTQTFAVKYAQTITFGALSNVLLSSPPFPISASASSGLPVNLASTTPGVCTVSGSTVTIVAAGTCSIAATQAGNANYAAAAPISQSFTVIGPAIKPGGITPIYSSSNTIQPGSWISIFGAGLAATTATWNGDFPISLGGVSVTINAKPAYLWYVSPTQINLQAPDDVTIGPVNVVVTNSSGTTTSTVTLAPISPSFSLLADGVHVAGVIPTPDGTGAYGGGTYDLVGPAGVFAFSTRPVKPGETLTLFGVGFGPTNPAVPAGKVFSGEAATINQVMISIGGVPANVAFEGITESGLYQFNITVPNTGSGDQALKAVVVGIQTQLGPLVTVQ